MSFYKRDGVVPVRIVHVRSGKVDAQVLERGCKSVTGIGSVGGFTVLFNARREADDFFSSGCMEIPSLHRNSKVSVPASKGPSGTSSDFQRVL